MASKKAAAPVSQAEYLKKYMSGSASTSSSSEKKVKKKKVKAKPVQAFKIVDADEEARDTTRRVEEIEEDGMITHSSLISHTPLI